VCTLLLSSLESLQRTLTEFSNLLSETGPINEAKVTVSDCRKRLNNLSDLAKVNATFLNRKFSTNVSWVVWLLKHILYLTQTSLLSPDFANSETESEF
jgi:site-specific recombinase XerD